MAERLRAPRPRLTGAAGRDLLGRLTVRAMVATDLGFLAYWAVVATGAVPARDMFAEYTDPRVAAWNWSFLPLDVAASLTGLAAARALRRHEARGTSWLAVSLALTATAGGMALAFWLQRGQFDPAWLVPNAFLLLFPLPMLARVLRR